MKIIIKDSEKNLNLTFPSRLVLNNITVAFAPSTINKKIREYGNGDSPSITSRQLRLLFREINRYRKKHKDWVLVEVEEASTGDRVVIKP